MSFELEIFIICPGQPGASIEEGIGVGDIVTQTRLAFRNAAEALAGVGLTLEDVVKLTVYLVDARDYIWMNMVTMEFFPNKPPARITLLAKPMADTKIELDIIAYKKSGD